MMMRRWGENDGKFRWTTLCMQKDLRWNSINILIQTSPRTTCCCMGMFHKIVIELFLEKNSDELVTFEFKLWILMKNFCSISRKLMHTGIHLNSLKTTYQESMRMRKKTKTAQSRVKSTKRQRQKRETAWYSHLDFHAF